MKNEKKMQSDRKRQKPLKLYDHLPEVLAAMPALGVGAVALLALPEQLGASWTIMPAATLFWIAVWTVIGWFIAFRWNMPKRRFFLVFGLLGTFIGIPIVLEMTGKISVFRGLFDIVGLTTPSANAGAYLMVSLLFAALWAIDFIWSRTHMKVKLTGSDVTIFRTGGRTETFELLGLKHQTEPLDYAEVVIGGFGSLAISLRSGKTIFSMNRVFHLYRVPWFPFIKGKKEKISELLAGAQVRIDQTMTPAEKRARLERLEADEGAIGEEDGHQDDDDDRLENPDFSDGSPDVGKERPDIR